MIKYLVKIGWRYRVMNEDQFYEFFGIPALAIGKRFLWGNMLVEVESLQWTAKK